MKVRGQNAASWLARWRKGMCPVHGVACVEEVADEEFVVAACAHEACDVVVALWPGKDTHHKKQGWLEGPPNIRASLAQAGEIEAEGSRPARWATEVRTSWILEPM